MTTKEILEKHDAKLALATDLQMAFKHPTSARIACAVVKAALGSADRRVWPDDEAIVAVVAKLDGADKNCVGIAWRMLGRVGVLERLGDRRRSKAGPSKGREIAEWRVKDMRLASVFLSRNGAALEPVQKELFV